MKQILIILFLMPCFAFAQNSQTFVVKKGADGKFIPGFYCSDYMTDGRACFYFDTLNTVTFFVSAANPKDIPQQYFTKPVSKYKARYTTKGDSIWFVSVAILEGDADFSPVRRKQTTAVKGKIQDDKIYLFATDDIDGKQISTREIFVRRLEGNN